MLTVDGLTDYLTLVIDIGRVLGNPYLLVRIGAHIGIQDALLRIDAILTLGSLRIVVDLVAVVHLTPVEHLLASDGIGGIQTLDGTLLVLVRLAGQLLLPVEVRLHGVAVLVFLNLVGLVTTIGRVSQTLAQNRVANIVDELTVHGVGDLALVHPEALY